MRIIDLTCIHKQRELLDSIGSLQPAEILEATCRHLNGSYNGWYAKGLKLLQDAYEFLGSGLFPIYEKVRGMDRRGEVASEEDLQYLEEVLKEYDQIHRRVLESYLTTVYQVSIEDLKYATQADRFLLEYSDLWDKLNSGEYDHKFQIDHFKEWLEYMRDLAFTVSINPKVPYKKEFWDREYHEWETFWKPYLQRSKLMSAA